MTDDNIEDISSHPYFVHGDFPFVFIPATSSTGFNFSNNHTHVFRNDNQMTTEVIDEKEEREKTVDDQNEENDDNANVRISQPKYSQLLKDLDFSEARVYDVTKLLSDEAGYYLTADENDNQKKLSGDEKYQSLSSTSSSLSANEPVNHQSSSNSDKNSSKIKQNENFKNASNDIQNGLNHLATIIQAASQISPEEYDSQQENGVHIDVNTHQRLNIEENDDTSKQATQNYDFDDKEKENIPSPYPPYTNSRFPTQNSHSTQDDNLSSIPRLNTRTETSNQSQEYHLDWNDLINGTDGSPTVVIFAQSIDDIHTTPTKQQRLSPPDEKSKQYVNSSPKQKARQRSRQLSSDTDSTSEYSVYPTKSKSQQELVIDEDLKQNRPTSASEILLRRLSNQQTSPNKKKSHHHRNEDHIQSKTNDTWLSMFEKLEREHKERLEKQQKQYEEYMRNLEEKMKQRFEEYLSSTNSLKESKSESLDSVPIDSNVDRCRTSPQYRPLAKDLNNHYYSTADKRQSIGTNLLRSQSREDISTLRTELLAKHAKHISDLKLYYEHEIDELKNQVNSSKMGHTSSTTRHSLETIERINNENNLLHDEIKELRQSLKSTTDENISLKRQVEELREQLNRKDVEVKSHRRTMTELEKQLNEARDLQERQDEKMRLADRQALFYKQENEKITNEFNLTRERLIRMEERYRDLENENKTFRHQGFANENNNQRINDNHSVNSAMPLNMPTSREYGRFTLTTSRYSSSTTSSPRNGNLDSGRYTSNDSDNLFRHGNSPRPLLTISDYLNEKPTFPPAYVPPSRPLYSPRRSPPNHHHMDQMPVRDLIDNHIKQSEQLEEKFDDLLKKKRDLESRINRIPTRGLTNTDRQLLDVLEREIERVEQQISSVKLELRKMNILRTH